MYTNDATFLSAINGQSRKIETKMMVGTVEVPLISVEFSDIRERLIGSFSAKMIKATYDVEDFSGSLLNEEISLYVMVSGSPLEVLIGKFYVDFEDITYDEINSTITFTAYDKAVKFNKQIEDLTFPVSETNLLSNISEKVGVSIERYSTQNTPPTVITTLPTFTGYGMAQIYQVDNDLYFGGATDIIHGYIPVPEGKRFTLDMTFTTRQDMTNDPLEIRTGTVAYSHQSHYTPGTYTFTVSGVTGSTFDVMFHSNNTYISITFDNFVLTIDNNDIEEDLNFQALNVSENQEYTYRDLVMDYATYKGLSAHISREGVLIFKNPFRTTVDAVIDGESYTDLKLNKQATVIDSVAFEYDNVTDPVWYNVSGVAGEFTNQITIRENALMSLLERENLEEVIEGIFNRVVASNPTVGFEYHTFESNQFTGPHYDAMDVIEILDKEDESYRSIAHSITWTWNGGMKGTMTGIFAEETRSDQKLSGTNRDLKSMGIKVDRVEGQITAFAETVETMDGITNELSNQLSITESQLAVEILNREQMGEEILDQLTAQLQFEVDGLNLSFGQLQEQIENGELSLAEINTYFDFSANGLVIGKSDSPLKIQIDNEEISFLQGGTPVAYINGSTLYIKQSTILDAITMANHIIEKSPFTNGRTLFRRV